MARKLRVENWTNESTSPEYLLKLAHRSLSPRKIDMIAAMGCRTVEHHFKGSVSFDIVQLLLSRANHDIDDTAFQKKVEDFKSLSAPIYTHFFRVQAPVQYSAYDAAVLAASAAISTERKSTLELLLGWISNCRDDGTNDTLNGYNRRNRHQFCAILREIVPAPDHEWNVLAPSHGGGLNQPDGRSVRLDDNAVSLARTIHVKQAYEMMPILADALEESGITDPTMLHHCREEREHMPGCWVVDLVLGHQ